MNPQENRDYQRKLQDLEKELNKDQPLKSLETKPGQLLQSIFNKSQLESVFNQLTNWFNSLPTAGKVAVVLIGASVGLSLLRSVLQLVGASALVPLSIGLYAKDHSRAQSVPLNPVLASTEEAIAQTLGQPRDQLTSEVAPLTNLFWCGALVMPAVVIGRQLYLLGKTGKTTPKRWFGVQVVTAYGHPPG